MCSADCDCVNRNTFNKICPPLTLLSHISQYKTGWINKRYECERYDVYERYNGMINLKYLVSKGFTEATSGN